MDKEKIFYKEHIQNVINNIQNAEKIPDFMRVTVYENITMDREGTFRDEVGEAAFFTTNNHRGNYEDLLLELAKALIEQLL